MRFLDYLIPVRLIMCQYIEKAYTGFIFEIGVYHVYKGVEFSGLQR